MTKAATKPKGVGRPRQADEVRKPRTIRMTDAEYAKLYRLGGADWLRGMIKRAKEPTAQQ
jgi:hypothetical protein